MNMYFLIEIRHNILVQCHGNYIEVRKCNYMLEVDILRKNSQNDCTADVLDKYINIGEAPVFMYLTFT